MDAINNIGSWFSSNPGLSKLLGIATGGAGAIGNLFASQKRNQVLNQSLNNQQNLMNLAANPTAVATNAAKLQQPLSAGLTSSVGNAVQGYLSERGLSQSPGIQSETLAQGLAPYQLQEQQLAMNAYLQSLGLPAQATPRFLPYPQSTDLSKIFQSLFSKPDPLSGGQFTPTTGPNLGQLSPPPTSGVYGDTGGGAAFDWMQMLNSGGGFDPSAAFATTSS